VLSEGDLPRSSAAQGATVRFRGAAEPKAYMAAGRERRTAAIKEAGITADWARAEKGSARRRRLR
jgi:hypothetical protein